MFSAATTVRPTIPNWQQGLLGKVGSPTDKEASSNRDWLGQVELWGQLIEGKETILQALARGVSPAKVYLVLDEILPAFFFQRNYFQIDNLSSKSIDIYINNQSHWQYSVTSNLMSRLDRGRQWSDVSLIKVFTIISILLDRINNSQNVFGKILISSLISYLSTRSNRII